MSSKTKPEKKVATLPINEIICGNAVEIMRTFPENSIDLTVTSPPYDQLRHYNGYEFNFYMINYIVERDTLK